MIIRGSKDLTMGQRTYGVERGWWALRRCRKVLLGLSLLFLLTGGVLAQEAMVYVIPVQGTIEPGLAEFLKRALNGAKIDEVEGVLLEIDTFGGRVDAATEIVDLILDMPMPVIAYVRGRAWSAGALIALAADYLVMAPGSSIGAAEPRPTEEKVVSALRAEFESLAERNDRDPQIAAAMVDKDVVVEGLVEKDKILTLSAKEAERRGFADFIAAQRHQVLSKYGFGDARIIEPSPNWAETLARFLTDPTVSSLLLSVGFLGLIVEITTPGWGVPGTGGLIALGLFFGGRMVAGLAGIESVIIFLIGVVLLALEVFVIPGFGLAGITGLMAIFYSILISFPSPAVALRVIVTSLIITVALGLVLIRRIGKSGVWRRFVLDTSETKEKGYVAPIAKTELLGKKGVAQTALRPSGIIEVEGERFDALSEGMYIPAGAPIVVSKVEGSKIIVAKLSE
jgi:membrane-bound serine protease (ClpP class)